MKFYDWYKSNTKDDLVRLAKIVNKSPNYLSLVARGHRNASHVLASEIEKATNGLVSKEEIRPDIFGDAA